MRQPAEKGAASAGGGRGPWRDAVAARLRALLLLCVGGLCLAGSACVPQSEACHASYGTGCSDWTFVTEAQDTHFELPPLERGQDHWVRAGDQLKVSWAEYKLLFNFQENVCDFSAATLDTEKCRRCFICDTPIPERPNCRFAVAFAEQNQPLLLAYTGFEAVAPYDSQYVFPGTMCENNGGKAFTPEKNSTYKVVGGFNTEGELARTKVFVLRAGAGQSVQYQMKPLARPAPGPEFDNVGFFSGKVPRHPVLEDIFSTNLRITKVRFLVGRPEADLITGKLRLEDATPAHPSRIVFIPGYTEGSGYPDSIRCYADQSEDGDIDLTRCRAVYGGSCTYDSMGRPQPASCNLLATPNYLLPIEKDTPTLTWVAEFKPSEGGVVPVDLDYDANGVCRDRCLGVEFTIEAQ